MSGWESADDLLKILTVVLATAAFGLGVATWFVEDESKKKRLKWWDRACFVAVAVLVWPAWFTGQKVSTLQNARYLEASNRLATAEISLSPSNQPIASVRASGFMKVRGNNRFPGNPSPSLLSLMFSSTGHEQNWCPMQLECVKLNSFGGADGAFYEFQFEQGAGGAFLWNLKTNNLTKEIETWDIVALSAIFLGRDCEVIDQGELVVTVNTVLKRYVIPAQRPRLVQSGDWIIPAEGKIVSNKVAVLVQTLGN